MLILAFALTGPPAGCGGAQEGLPKSSAELEGARTSAEAYLTGSGTELAAGKTDGASVYSVDVTLDVAGKTVRGKERVLFTNRTTGSLGEVVFRVYANDTGAGPAAISRAEVDGRPADSRLDGDILTVSASGGIDPGERALVSFEFVEPVPPSGRDNTGGIYAYEDGTFDLGNFLPTVARCDGGTWDTRPSPENGDMSYFDCSYYLVSFRAPGGYVVAATGVDLGTRDGARRFAAGPVRDFEVQASRRYGSVERRVGATKVTSFYLEGDSEGGAEALDAGCRALSLYSEHFGPYPYRRLNICEAPLEEYGMEYPGQVLIASFVYDDPEYAEDLELTVAHEVCHQWWALGVGSDSVGMPWLDESLTSYCEYLYSLWQNGEESAQETLEELTDLYVSAREEDVPDAVVEQADAAFEDGDQYTAVVYGKGALFYDELRDLLGEAAFDESLGEYYRKNVFGNATAAEVLSAFRDNSQAPAGVDALYTRWIREVHGDEDVPYPYE